MTSGISHICLADDDADDHLLFMVAMNEILKTVTLTCFDTCRELNNFLHTSENLPDLIVLDVNMPGNRDFECLVSIKAQKRVQHIPVVVWSTASTESLKNDAIKKGAAAFIIKSNTLEGLKNVVQEIVSLSVGNAVSKNEL